MTKIIWHYTTIPNLISILADGAIKPATARVPAGEKPAVWFSTHQHWEPMATKGMVDHNAPSGTRSAMDAEMDEIGRVRIAIAPDLALHD